MPISLRALKVDKNGQSIKIGPDDFDAIHVDAVSHQQVNSRGMINVGKTAWLVRVIVFIAYIALISYILYFGIVVHYNWLLVYSVVMPLTDLLGLIIGWVMYRNPVQNKKEIDKPSMSMPAPLVSVIVPIYNQQGMIRTVIDAILLKSTYQNIEVIAVDDGSKDNTGQIIDKLGSEYPSSKLKIIHVINGGKRRAVARAFYESSGKYIVMIDSDSIIDAKAIEQFVKTFELNPNVGGMVGHIKVANAGKNLLTRFQDVWYDFAFNVTKASESYFGSVICLSGCLAAYRRETIADFIPYWANAFRVGEDKELTMYSFAPSDAVRTDLKQILGSRNPIGGVAQNLMESAAKYDDAEDRVLSAHSIMSWKNVYVTSAVGYTEAPEKIMKFFKQQIRWKKSFLRTNFYLNAFMWQKHPIVALHFYIMFLSTLTMPLVIVINLWYIPFVLGNWTWSLGVMITTILAGLMQGVDYHFRDPNAKYWLWKPLTLLFTSHVVVWLIIPALIQFNGNKWGTR